MQEHASKAEEALYDIPVEVLLGKIKGKMKHEQTNPTGPHSYSTTSVAYERDQDNVVYVKRRAQGRCDLCQKEAPFIDKKGHPYLEAHHVQWLSKGGEDNINNMVALCPDCHRKMHILARKEDVALLEKVLDEYLDEAR